MQKKSEQLVERPPVVVVMGHVDHGKSTLLDQIRKANTVDKEAGGITQHVAAYEVAHPSTGSGQAKRITFIDTPGHAAFSAIRARGANVADIAILVVAADDGVKAQTLEALEQIRESGIPFVVAINKIDKPNADLARTQASLLEHGVYLEKLGGDIPWQAISAKTGTGVQELLDLILIVAEMDEETGDPNAPGEGWVIEAHRDPKRGIAATLIITNGSLKSGTFVLAGRAIAPVRIMENHVGKSLKSATFSTPVRIVGFDDLPAIGEKFRVFAKKRDAEDARETIALARPAAQAEAENEEIFYLPIIVRADASGSLEAILSEVARIGDEYSRISIVQSGIGTVSESDIKAALAGRVQGIVIGFNIGTDPVAEALARERGVRIETFSIIYKLTERVEELLGELRPKHSEETVLGTARVLKVFSSRKTAHLIGGKVLAGILRRRAEVRIKRKSEIVGTGFVDSIETNRQSSDRVQEGSEFGAQIDASEAIAEGDILECFTTELK